MQHSVIVALSAGGALVAFLVSPLGLADLVFIVSISIFPSHYVNWCCFLLFTYVFKQGQRS
jgi:hypothetical protein